MVLNALPILHFWGLVITCKFKAVTDHEAKLFGKVVLYKRATIKENEK